ncbi:MAG TPA: alpha/beta fold hydrolase, partial [Candidatus Omnitrophota bacterium]|nr:alpha/beta fold hydrolase [Candidatus Omnitrophota bacterium]
RTNVMYRKWGPPSPKVAVLCVHGLGGHSGRWGFLGEALAQKNMACYAVELKGFGEAEGLKGHVDSFQIYFDDIRALRAIIKNDHPRGKVFLAGESFGGLLAFLLAVSDPGVCDGLICLSPAFKSRLKFPARVYASMIFCCLFHPRKQFTVPFCAPMCTRDTDYQKVMDGDQREHRFATARFLANSLAAQIRSQFLKGRLSLPTLFLLAGRDVMVDPGASLGIYKSLNVKDKTIVRYPEMAHALSIDRGREKVFEDIAAWLEERAV